MEKQIQLVLYGNSLFVNGIARSLDAEPNLEVVQVQDEALEACLPDEVSGACLLAFDIHEASPEMMLALFKGNPDLTLLALDPEGDRLMVLSGQASGARTIGDLMEVIRRHGKG